MKSLEELKQIREQMKARINGRAVADGDDVRIVVGMATCGIAAGAREVLRVANEEIGLKKVPNAVVSQTGCIGICKYEPIVEVFVPGEEKVTYVHVNPERMKAIIASHILNGNPINEYTYGYAVKEGK